LLGTFLFRVRLIFLGVVAFLGNVAGAQADTGKALRLSLINMGYDSISLDGCVLNFERHLAPTVANEGKLKYSRYENLDSLAGFSDGEIEMWNIGGREFYVFQTPYEDHYGDVSDALLCFRHWLQKTNPDVDFIAYSRSQNGSPDLAIEAAFREYFTNFDRLNRWVNYFSNGDKTSLRLVFDVSFYNRDPLEEFLFAVRDYAADKGCDLDN